MKEKPLWKEPLAILFGSLFISIILFCSFDLIQQKYLASVFAIVAFLIGFGIIVYGAWEYGESFR